MSRPYGEGRGGSRQKPIVKSISYEPRMAEIAAVVLVIAALTAFKPVYAGYGVKGNISQAARD